MAKTNRYFGCSKLRYYSAPHQPETGQFQIALLGEDIARDQIDHHCAEVAKPRVLLGDICADHHVQFGGFVHHVDELGYLLRQVLQVIVKGDDELLLIEDGVYAAMKNGKGAAMLDGIKVSVLGPDLAARGISEDKLVDGVKVVDYADFVDMVEASDKVQSWL